MSAAKRDFGSFHSSNVQELLDIQDDEYVPPELPFRCELFETYKSNPPIFGKEIKQKHFLLEDCVFLNHGAFGGVLKDALDIAQKYQIWTERQPLRFYDRELLPRLVHVTRRIAKFINCNAKDIVLVENATTALNTVIQNIPLKQGDNVFILNVTYGAVKKMLRWRCEQTGAQLQEVEVDFPIKDKQQLIDYVDKNLKEGSSLAVFDHIPSNTPFIMPLTEIITICKSRNVPVLIDGAHGLGSLPLNITSLDPDYYITNAHKWFCSPKGTALMYVRKELQTLTRPLIISHGFGSGFNSEFIWAGLHDYSPFLALHTVLDFWEGLGQDRAHQYMHGLCKQAGRMLFEGWNTEMAAPEDMFGSMCLVRLPDGLQKISDHMDYSAAETIQNTLYHDYNIEVPVKCVQQRLYVRISAHIYNEMSEYKTLRDAVLDIEQSYKEETCQNK
ncbi:uncharacterized protein LOC132712792 [Ruditapes philippinarum]|uniref:uncharacterized protein LOC132712792 n=1 Tax=Ruditapes philippinarum TaxID=129788 RepID=UPI00295C078C|nr:uncharacterized protein LOC132712792 [Ruditapes philippinarum]